MISERYGPNHSAVNSFVEGLSIIPWFTALGEPTAEDSVLVRVGLDDVLEIHPNQDHMWGNVLHDNELPIDRLILDSCRLGADNALQSAVHITGDPVDDFYVGLVQNHPGYYRDSHMYVYELVHLPERLVLYAAREMLVADLAPELHFFTDLMPWFGRGHWPLGWQGNWPNGKLIVW